MDLHLSQNPEADKLLSKNPLALLIGMVLDQQVPLEWAFAGPLELQKRLGRKLDATDIASMDIDALSELFAIRPALHRYPGSMAKRVHAVCAAIVDEYGGKAANVWKEAGEGEELLARIKALPGFGEQKAKIFVALLGKQLGVRPDGWREASTPFGEAGSFRSVADITGEDTLAKVRAFKADMKAKTKAKAKAGVR
ncbi:MAG: HhH-GPD-type base excision DNA repair protein [Acidimicrobiales bacterium]